VETIFYVLLTGLNAEQSKQVKLFLTIDKPIFVEEVAEPWQDLYLALEYIVLPDSLSSPSPDSLLLRWETDLDRAELYELVAPFHKANVIVDTMLLVPEGGDAIWIKSLDGQSWLDERALVAVRGDFSSDKRVIRWMLRNCR